MKDRASKAQVIDAEVATEAKYEIEMAANQARKPEPDAKVLTERLEKAGTLVKATALALTVGEVLIQLTHQITNYIR